MANLSSNEADALSKFFSNFTTPIVKILSQNFDNETYQKIDLTVDSAQNADEIKTYNENSIFYKLEYAQGAISSALAVLISEEFVADLTDVIMGGKGEGSYKGSLSELEVNSFSDLFNKIFKEIETSFKTTYNKDLAFNPKPSFLLKEMPEYEEEFANPDFDFIINFKLVLNETKECIIHLLLQSKELKQIIPSLRLLQDGSSGKLSDLDAISINQLSDVKIDITAELGKARVPMKYALELVRGSLIELDTMNNTDIKVYANGVEVAMAQIVAVEDNFGLRITKIISPEERLKHL